MKNLFLKAMVPAVILVLILGLPCFALAADTVMSSPIFEKLSMAVNQICSWLFGISTAAALIGIVTGQLMIKLSFGNEEQIIKGKRLTKNVIWAYAIVASSSLILKAIDSFVGQ